MQYILNSPIVRTMFGLNALVVLALILSTFWPLPKLELVEGPDIQAQDIADFLGEGNFQISEAINRPLFHANRRPAVLVAAIPEAVKKPEVRVEQFTLELVGIMGADDQNRTAFLLDSESAQTHSVKIDHVLNGWTVTEISRDMVSLSKELEQRTLSLK